MKKVDFRKITLKNVEGEEMSVDFSKELGNHIYMQGQHIEECELGKRMYFDGEVEMNEKGIEVVKRFVAGYPYVSRTAVIDAINKALS